MVKVGAVQLRNKLIWYLHIHCLVTDGAFDAVGHFHPLAVRDNDQATLIFREKVFAMMCRGAACLRPFEIEIDFPAAFLILVSSWRGGAKRKTGRRWAGWRSWSTNYIPFSSLIEQDRLMFKRFWFLYLIATHFISKLLSKIALVFPVRHTFWLILLLLLVIAVTHYILRQKQSDLVSQREPEYEAADSDVMVGFDSQWGN